MIRGVIFWCCLALLGLYVVQGKSHGHQSNKRSASKHGFSANLATRNGSADPEVNKRVAQMIRFIVHNTEWVSVATISTDTDVAGFPFDVVKSMVDGPVDNSTGIPYFYISPLEFVGVNLKKDSRASITMSMKQDGYCTDKDFDAEDLRCGRVIAIGHIKPLPKDAPDYKFARDALFARHPSMADWPKDRKYYVAKMDLHDVVLFYGSYEAQCAVIPLYLASEPKYYKLEN